MGKWGYFQEHENINSLCLGRLYFGNRLRSTVWGVSFNGQNFCGFCSFKHNHKSFVAKQALQGYLDTSISLLGAKVLYVTTTKVLPSKTYPIYTVLKQGLGVFQTKGSFKDGFWHTFYYFLLDPYNEPLPWFMILSNQYKYKNLSYNKQVGALRTI